MIGLVSKIKTCLIMALTLSVALALTVAPLMIVPTVHALTSAPDFTMTGWPDGNNFTLSSFRGGKVCLLEFFQTECPYCQNESKQLVAVDKYFGNGIPMVSVDMKSADWTDANLTSYNATYGPINWKTAKDTNGTGWTAYQHLNGTYDATPEIFIIDKNGNIAFNYVGVGGVDPTVSSSTLIADIDGLIPLQT